jgi:RNA polymerase sigma-70 factor, ECF subfamily
MQVSRRRPSCDEFQFTGDSTIRLRGAYADDGRPVAVSTPHDESEIAVRIRAGDQDALGVWLDHHGPRLSKMVRLRMDPRIVRRVSPSDVLQDTFLDAARRIKEYLDHPDVPFFIWLRFLTAQRLSQLHRQHLGVQARDADREISIGRCASADMTSQVLAAQFVGRLTSPSMAAQKSELRKRLQEVLDQMDPLDREVLALRHFEQLTNQEVAQTLNLSTSAASKRYVRALDRLRVVLSIVPGQSMES